MTIRHVDSHVIEGTRRPTDEEIKTGLEASRAMLTIVNGLPPNLRESVIGSFLVSICMNSPDPKYALAVIGINAMASIKEFLSRGGHA